MGLHPHYLMDLISAAIASMAVVFLVAKAGYQPRRHVWLAAALLTGFIWFTAALATVRVSRIFGGTFTSWVRCVGMFVTVGTVYGSLLFAAVRSTRKFQPSRRRAVKALAAAAAVTPAGVAAFGIVRRDDLQFREVDIRIPGLPPDLHGLRIAQISDIHLSSFVPEWLLERAVGMANDTRPHIALVTGDLISVKGDPLDRCLERLKALRADAGVFGCCGNHEIYAGAEAYLAEQGPQYGIRFLRQESVPLYFGGAVLNLAGVDYQRRGRPYLVQAESLTSPGAFNVLLSHNPDVFPVAAKKGFDLTLAGHTHGGQVQFEMIHPSLNIARFATPFVYGPYEHGDKRLYVTRGIGTIGVPARVGAPPEVVCLRLCAISS